LLNLGILAHVDAGKTSLTERLLHSVGVIDQPGRVDDGDTRTQTLALERRRGIIIKSAVAFGALLRQGIGDTIRVSLSAPPVEEVKVGIQILQSLNLKTRQLEIVSCPSCGRAQVDVYKLADEVTAGLEGMEVPLRVAVMGCVVNGPGEAREADLGVASGNGKGQIFVKGKVIKTVPEHQIVETLIEEAMRIAETMEGDGSPVVSVS